MILIAGERKLDFPYLNVVFIILSDSKVSSPKMRFRIPNRFNGKYSQRKGYYLNESEDSCKTRLSDISRLSDHHIFPYFRNLALNTALLELKNKSLNINRKAALSTD